MPHQQKALQYLRRRGGVGELFMEMRLGKTLVVIRYLQEEFKGSFSNGSFLVVAPIEALWAWKRELNQEGIEPVVLLGSAQKRKEAFWFNINKQAWFLINYEGLKMFAKEFQNTNFKALVIDESRRMANPKNVTTKLLHSFPRKAGCRFVLSGKPAPESPLEYFEQLSFVEGSFMNCTSYWQFRQRYFRELAPHEWIPKPGALDEIKSNLHAKAFFMTRKEAGIKTPKIKEVRTVRLPAELRKMYEKIKDDFVAELSGKVLRSTKWVPVQYLWLHQLSSGFLGERLLWSGKMDALLDLLQGELQGEPTVVWFRFNAPLFEAAKRIKRAGLRCACITGDENTAARFSAIDAFRKGELDTLLVQLKCGRTAIDLSTSSTAIYFCNSHSLEDRLQSEDRLVNPLKREPCLYLDLVAEQTIEEDILTLLHGKKNEAAFYESKFLINQLRKEILV